MRKINIFLFERLTIQLSTSAPFLTTHLQDPNNLPRMVNKRISDLSSNKEELYKIKSACETSLNHIRYFSSVCFNKSHTQNTCRYKNVEIIWFNPLNSQNVKTNIGKMFIKLLWGNTSLRTIKPSDFQRKLFSAWCPLKGHTYLNKPFFKYVWPFTGYQALKG